MTEKKINPGRNNHMPSSFRLEASRSNRGMAVVLSGIISVDEFSEERVVLKSHGGKILITGKRLLISIFDNNDIEITGKTEAINFIYGKA